MEQTWTQPLISVDVVPLVFHAGQVAVVLGRRRHDPHLGEFALPGVLMQREQAIEAATRALTAKVGLDVERALMHDIGVFDSPGRDDRGPTLSVAKVVPISPLVLEAEGETGQATPILEVGRLPFDHNEILAAACRRCLELLWSDRGFTRAFFGDTLSAPSAYAAQSQLAEVGGVDGMPVQRNLKRRILGTGWVEMTADLKSDSRLGRPAYLMRWT